MLTKFAIELLNEAAEECEEKACSLSEPESKRELFATTADKVLEIMEILVEQQE